MKSSLLKKGWLSACLLVMTSILLTPVTFAGERLDRIMATKVVRVGTPGDYKPFAIKTADGFSGHDIDLIEKMAREMGVKVEFVQTSWPTMMQDLADNKFDVAVGGITRTLARVQKNEMLPGYAPFGKVALIRAKDKNKYTTLASMNQPGVRVIKNPGGTNEVFVLQNLPKANVSTHDKNAEIPALIAEGKGDVMITETAEAIQYSKADPRLYPAFLQQPLTPKNYMGFMLPKDDADYVRVMSFVWDQLDKRGELQSTANKWLK